MKIAIVGSRDYPQPSAVSRYVGRLHMECPDVWGEGGLVIVSGGARGVDSWAADEARIRDIPVEEYPAEWVRYGKRAGFLRNEDIVKAANKVVAFWDGESRGTKHTIDLALRHKKHLEVIFP